MGLSSSQARLLHLTSRMHQIEYKAAKLEAEKLQMANESSRVYEDYLFALDKTKIQSKILTTDGSITYVDANYQSALDNGYLIRFVDTDILYGKNGVINDGKITISQEDYDTYIKTQDKNFFIAVQTGRVDENGVNKTDGYQEIYTEDHLRNINTSTRNYRLMSDINISSGWNSVNIQNATFDGNGHSITGLDKCLFDTISGSTVKNLSVNGNIGEDPTRYNAIFARIVNNSSNIENIVVTGSIGGINSAQCAALIGSVSDSTVKNCTANNVSVQAKNIAGGLIANANKATIENCYVSGTVNGENTIGGFVGNISDTIIKNSSANTQVLNDNYTTNTKTSGYYTHTGGFVGNVTGTTEITNCSASGTVETRNEYYNGGLAGFVGQILNSSTCTINNSTSYASVTNNIPATNNDTIVTQYISAFGADLQGQVILNNCDALGNISGSIEVTASDGSIRNQVGELVAGTPASGANTNINNCYATDIAGIDVSGKYANIGSKTLSATPNNNPNSGMQSNVNTTVTVSDATVSGQSYTYGTLYEKIESGQYTIGDPNVDPTNGYKNDTTWFTNMINNGKIILSKQNENDEIYDTSVATDTNLQEVSDESLLKKAEAKYEADMKKIDRKDRQYDTELAKLENERNAISQEMETLKTVAKENVDRTFKLFS